MFIEPERHSPSRGWIEVICGSMFSGKTEELIRRLKRARIAQQQVRIFKPDLDTRYHAERIVSHDENSTESLPVPDAASITLLAQNAEVIGVDEAQFFSSDLVEVCSGLANRGVRVIVAGLDMDYTGKPFGPIPDLLAVAEYITKLHAICIRCGGLAHFSYRRLEHDGQVLIGEHKEYEARCRHCFHLPD